MSKLTSTASVLAFLVAGATAASAQTSTVFNSQDAVSDGVESINDAAQNDLDKGRDARDFGIGRSKIGWYGSLSATANAASGNNDTANVGIGSNFGYFDGKSGHDVNITYNYGEEDGDSNSNQGALGYDYNYFFTQDFYGFGQLRGSYDEFGSYEIDSFIGAGVGYRVINNANTSWSLQAGPGYRYAELSNGDNFEEAALSVGSKFYYEINDNVFISDTTDILYSDSDTAIVNDLGLNVSMGGGLALRTSLRTEYHTDPLPGDDSVDNLLGVSLVYTFN